MGSGEKRHVRRRPPVFPVITLRIVSAGDAELFPEYGLRFYHRADRAISLPAATNASPGWVSGRDEGGRPLSSITLAGVAGAGGVRCRRSRRGCLRGSMVWGEAAEALARSADFFGSPEPATCDAHARRRCGIDRRGGISCRVVLKASPLIRRFERSSTPCIREWSGWRLVTSTCRSGRGSDVVLLENGIAWRDVVGSTLGVG